MSIYGYEVSDGQAVYEYHVNRRRDMARTIWEERRRIREINQKHNAGFSPKVMNDIVRDCVARKFGPICYAPFRPTLANFREAASDNYAYGNSSWHNHLDTEYYSACGYDDYMGEKRDAAIAQAVEYFRAWKYMKAQVNA